MSDNGMAREREQVIGKIEKPAPKIDEGPPVLAQAFGVTTQLGLDVKVVPFIMLRNWTAVQVLASIAATSTGDADHDSKRALEYADAFIARLKAEKKEGK